jgi:hypothetical protein
VGGAVCCASLRLRLAVRDPGERPPVTVTVDPCPADVNNSGQVTVQDIFDFLTSWFAGCP